MEFEAEHRFEGARQAVWEALHDPDILSRALPGDARMERLGEDAYTGELRAGVGPVTAARFDVKVTLADEVPPEAFTMLVDGRGAAGFVEGPVQVTLAEDGPDATLMRYSADLQIGGRIAGVGQRLLDSVGKGMARKSLEEVNQHMRTVAAGEAGAGGAESAALVRRTVPAATPSRAWPLLIGAAALVLIVLLVVLL